ncbi:MAG: type IV toxin-antitoxin system AbiEi family antitoxin [Pseudomonadota bacterium]
MVSKSVTFSGKRKGLSERESYLLSYLSEKRKSIFSLHDVMTVLKCRYENAKVIAGRLKKKKWIISVAKGKYLIAPLAAGVKGEYTEHEFVLASVIAEPCYIAYWTALNHYGFTEQVPGTVFVATRKKAKGREIFGTKYKFVSLLAHKFFGFSEIPVSSYRIKISDKEKTIIDCLDKPGYCGGIEEIVKAVHYAKNEIDFDKMAKYALKMKNNAVIKRLGFILDFLGLEPKAKSLENKVSASYAVLDPTKEKKGRMNSKWKLRINVSESDLMTW